MTSAQRLLSAPVKAAIGNLANVSEVRLRVNRPLQFARLGRYELSGYTVSEADVDYTLSIASHNSIYAVQDALLHGYLPYDGGVRVGVAGEGATEKGKLVSLRNITSLVVRIPRAVNNISDRLEFLTKSFTNTLIVSPPGAGKTTLLRELVRRLSDQGKRIMLIDERNEICAGIGRSLTLDVGACTDALIGIPKSICYESCIRTMSPQIIATDEVFGKSEVDALGDCVRSGVNVLASVHGESIDGVLKSSEYSGLVGFINNYVRLSSDIEVGRVAEVRRDCLG